jgi:micrococcal nuclease
MIVPRVSSGRVNSVVALGRWVGWIGLAGCARLPSGESDGAFDGSTLPSGLSPCRDAIQADVIETKDGDTIEVADTFGVEFIVRMIGADAPETSHDPAECWGPEAAEYTADRLLGETVWITFDRECTDLYGRSLAYVHAGVDGASFFNEQLLRDGNAGVMPIPPNDTFSDRFLEAQVESRNAGAGMWGACL